MARPSSPARTHRSGAPTPVRHRPGALPYRGPVMRNPDRVRRVLQGRPRPACCCQTYALTGDLPAARAAVRDAFVVAWHHWRKVSRLEDPEAWARAARLVARAAPAHRPALAPRQGPRPRDQGHPRRAGQAADDPAPDAAAHPAGQRARMADMAREVGIPRAEAERELQTATAQFARAARRVHHEHPRRVRGGARARRGAAAGRGATIIRRAGAARRRTHTAVGVVAAVAALVLTGVLVTDAAGVRPTLDRGARGRRPRRRTGGVARPEAEPAALPGTAMLTARQRRRTPCAGRAGASTTPTTTPTATAWCCPASRRGTPTRGATAALLRTFVHLATRRPAARSPAYQATEVSQTTKAAGRTFDRTARLVRRLPRRPRVQLLHDLPARPRRRPGDPASCCAPGGSRRRMVVGVARTGALTTTTLVPRRRVRRPPTRAARPTCCPPPSTSLCDLPDAGACAHRPRTAVAPPVPVGQVPGMLGEIDLPPVDGVTPPVGRHRAAQGARPTSPRPAATGPTSTRRASATTSPAPS